MREQRACLTTAVAGAVTRVRGRTGNDGREAPFSLGTLRNDRARHGISARTARLAGGTLVAFPCPGEIPQ
jgi:hypothetical protein